MADTLVSKVLRELVVSATEPRKNPITHIHTQLDGSVVECRPRLISVGLSLLIKDRVPRTGRASRGSIARLVADRDGGYP